MATLASVEKALKIITPFKKLQTAWQDEQKALKWFPTRDDFYGRKAEIPIGTAPGGGQSYNFNTSQRQSARGRQYDNFNVTRTSSYTLLYIEAEAIEASEGGEDTAFLETFKAELEGANITNAQETAGDIWGDGTGTWGVISAITSPGAGARITLTDPEAIVRVEQGREIQAVDPSTTPDTLRGGVPGYMTVTGVRESDGSFTVDNSTYITSLTVGDLLCFNSCYNAAPKGVRAWVPFTDTELTNNATLFGMDRTTGHVERKAGRRYDGRLFGLAEALERAIAYGKRGNMKTSDMSFWVNDRYFSALSLEMGAKAEREFKKTGEFGFTTLILHAPGGDIGIMADQNVPDGFAAGLSRNTWCWFTLKKAPRYLTPDGSKSIVKATDDGVEVRWGWRGSPVCTKPADNIIVQMPSIS